ncbi:MAG: hypothetical protein ACRCT8_10455, partial [Lacipirellulaceae bacterium]
EPPAMSTNDTPTDPTQIVIDTHHKARVLAEVLAAKGVTIEVTPEGVRLLNAAGKLGPRDVRWLKRERDNLRRHLPTDDQPELPPGDRPADRLDRRHVQQRAIGGPLGDLGVVPRDADVEAPLGEPAELRVADLEALAARERHAERLEGAGGQQRAELIDHVPIVPTPEGAIKTALNPWRCPKCASPELVYREDHDRNPLHRCGRCGLTWHWGDPTRLAP